MTFNWESIIGIIDSLGFIQGILLGGFFIVNGNLKQKRYNLLFGFFIFTYALELTTSLLEYTSPTPLNPRLDYLPTNFWFLSLPLFYLYVKNISVFRIVKKDFRILIPGIIEFLIWGIMCLFYSTTTLYKDLSNSYIILSIILFIPFNLYILKKIIALEKKHADIIRQQYSETEELSITWCRNAAFMFIFFLILYSSISLMPNTSVWHKNFFNLSISILNTSIIYWISFKAYEQKVVRSLVCVSNYKNSDSKETQAIDKTLINKDFELIDTIVSEKNLFKITDLTILALSKYIEIHPKKISKAINYRTQQNFNTYINSFRIDEAKKMLTTNQFKHLSIEGIGIESGFKSKSAFYKAFKSITGLTPFRYREKSTS